MPRKSLQKLIDECTRASSKAWVAQNALNDRCEEIWGMTPGDLDADTIIDGVYAANGPSNPMTAAQFKEEMQRALGPLGK